MTKIFCERFRKLRRDREISQAKLAIQLGMSQQAVNSWEQGQAEPGIEMLMRIAIFFDVTTDYLVGLSNDISKMEIGRNAKNSFNNNSGSVQIGNRNTAIKNG